MIRWSFVSMVALACILVPVAQADIGNLGWAPGAAGAARLSAPASSWAVRAAFEPSFGKTYWTRHLGTQGAFKSSQDYAAIMVGAIVPLHRLRVGQAELDLSLSASAGPDAAGFDQHGWGLRAAAGPEIGIVVNPKSATAVRIFGSVAPGVGRGLGSSASSTDLDFLYVAGFGAELGMERLPINLAAGLRLTQRGGSPTWGNTLTRKDQTAFLSFRFRLF